MSQKIHPKNATIKKAVTLSLERDAHGCTEIFFKNIPKTHASCPFVEWINKLDFFIK